MRNITGSPILSVLLLAAMIYCTGFVMPAKLDAHTASGPAAQATATPTLPSRPTLTPTSPPSPTVEPPASPTPQPTPVPPASPTPQPPPPTAPPGEGGKEEENEQP